MQHVQLFSGLNVGLTLLGHQSELETHENHWETQLGQFQRFAAVVAEPEMQTLKQKVVNP